MSCRARREEAMRIEIEVKRDSPFRPWDVVCGRRVLATRDYQHNAVAEAQRIARSMQRNGRGDVEIWLSANITQRVPF